MNIVMWHALRANQCSQGAVQNFVCCQDLTLKQLVEFNIVCQIIALGHRAAVNFTSMLFVG